MTDKSEAISVLVTVPVTWRRVCDLICTGVEGGYSPWLHSIERQGEWNGSEMPAYYDPEFWTQGGRYAAKFDLESDQEGDGNGRAMIDSAALVNGLRLMASDQPRHFADFVAENDDAITGDVFLQCVLLKAVIYG